MHEKIIEEIDLHDIPVQALRSRTLGKLSCMLNKFKVLPSPEPLRLPRDYRGIAHLMDISLLEGWLGNNPMEKLLKEFGAEKNLTLGELQSYFEKIDRYDVLDDTASMFHADAVEYESKKNSLVSRKTCGDLFFGDDKNILTLDDIIRSRNGTGPQMYDAFILYVDVDRAFAEEVIKRMENDFGLKICDKDRDLVAGLSFEHTAIMKLISERCHRLLVILSDEFVRSDRHTFFVKYAQAINYEQGHRKVIPCIFRECELPFEYRTYVCLDFKRYSSFCNFWEKLYGSLLPIKFNENISNNQEPNRVVIEDVTLEEKTASADSPLRDGDANNERSELLKTINEFSNNIPIESSAKMKNDRKPVLDKPRSKTVTKKIQRLLSNVKIKTDKPKKKKIACAL